MIKFLIVDDEEISRQGIRFLLERKYPNCRIDEAKSGIEAIEQIKQVQPQVVFLDIQMPDLNGFEVLQSIEERNFSIVFQTAYSEFALRAFEENACDYILKPFTDDRFYKALDKALQNPELMKLERLNKFLFEEKRFLNKIVGKIGSRVQTLNCDELLYFLSEYHISYAISLAHRFTINYSLKHLMEQLDPSEFIQIRANVIIRKAAIKFFTEGVDFKITLHSGEVFIVAKERRAKVALALKYEGL